MGAFGSETSRYIHEQEYWLTHEAWRVIVCSDFICAGRSCDLNVPFDKP